MRSQAISHGRCDATGRQVRRGKSPVLAALLQGSLIWFRAHLERHRSRRILMAMSDEQLKDIGLSRSTAYAEGARPFWD